MIRFLVEAWLLSGLLIAFRAMRTERGRAILDNTSLINSVIIILAVILTSPWAALKIIVGKEK